MAGVNRRDFLKALGLGSSVSALSACGLDDNRYYTPIEQVLPYVVRPELTTPGTPSFFATAVASGPSARPLLARHRDGRVINVGPNLRVPMGPAVPVHSYFDLQKHYCPDRVTGPKDGNASGADITWEQGLAKLADAVKAARSAGKKVAYLGGYHSGPIATLLRDFTDDNALFWEPLGYEDEADAAEALFGKRVLPRYVLDDAAFVLSFGAEFLGGWGNPDTECGYSQARDPNHNRKVGRFALVSAHRDHTGANADDWYPCVPGAEVEVARAVAKLVAADRGYNGPLLGLIGDVDVDSAAEAAGLQRSDIEDIVSHFGTESIALPGGTGGSSAAAVDLAAATYLINAINNESRQTPNFHLGGYTDGINGFSDVEALIADLQAGTVGVLILDDTNPVYNLPKSVGVAEAIGKADMVVSVSSHTNETNAAAQLVLPASGVLEDWGSEQPVEGLHLVRQPAMTPLYNTRSLGDMLLATARGAGLMVATDDATTEESVEVDEDSEEEVVPALPDLGFAPATWHAYVRAWWMHHVHDGIADTDSAWTDSLREGFFQKPENAVKAVVTATSYAFGGAATFEGSGEFYLRAFPHAFLQDGRYANQPWAQEAPDPQTGNVWDTWVEMHPDTADKLGVARNSEVEITSPHGTIKIGVHAQRGVRKDTVAIAFGNGHTANGRYSDGYGVNVVDLLGLARTANGGLAWQQAKVTVKATGQKADLVTTYSPYGTTDEQRGFAYPVNADALGKAGDDAREHPGDLIGIHHLPRDPRLIKADITNFYELPEHPVYRWGMTIDTNACNGCGACVVACYAENNLPVVGKAKVAEGREMGWVRINRYTSEHDGNEEVTFVPMMCQHCGHAGCESVCPVLATYHTIEGLNAMVYNRCVGTRYCSNACPFSVRRFNYHSYVWPEPFNLLLNPDVSTRTMGVMEKCTFCVQRIREMKSAYRDEGFDKTIPEEAMSQLTACAEACPSQAMVFGNLNDPNSGPSKLRNSGRSYYPLVELNVFPAINYMAKASFHVEEAGHHGGGHGDAAHGAGHDDGHAEDPAHADEHGHEKEAADEHHAEEPSHPASHDADGH